jgi:hypothetical protein
MALVRVNLDTAADEPYTPRIDALMREKPLPRDKRVVTKNGNLVTPKAR